jgi:hypothetical protein
MAVSWDVASNSLVQINRSFKGAYCLHPRVNFYETTRLNISGDNNLRHLNYYGRAIRSRQKWTGGRLLMRTMVLLNIIHIPHIQTHVKSHTCCVFVHVTND